MLRKMLCGLMVAGLIAGATALDSAIGGTTYDDIKAGNWDCVTVDPWSTQTGAYPTLGTDDAIINGFDVTVPAGFTIPALNSLQITGPGRLLYNHNDVINTLVTMSSGAEIRLSANDASTKVDLNGGLDVSGIVTLTTRGYDGVIKINTSGITNSASTDRINVCTKDTYGYSGVEVWTPSTGYTGEWVLKNLDAQHGGGSLVAAADGALGTGTVYADTKQVVFRTSNQTANGPTIIATGAGTATAGGACRVAIGGVNGTGGINGDSQPHSITWANSAILYLNASSLYMRNGSQWNSPISISTGTSSIVGEWSGTDSNNVIGGNITSSPGDGANAIIRLYAGYAAYPFLFSGNNTGFYGLIDLYQTGNTPRLYLRSEAAAGNAASIIRLNTGTTLYLDKTTNADWTLTNTLTGVGTIQVETGSGYKLTSSGGTISPGLSPGTLTINGNFGMSNNASLQIEIMDTATHDALAVNGTVDVSGGKLDIVALQDPLLFGSYVSILNNNLADTITGPFANDVAGKVLFQWNNVGYTADVSYVGDFATGALTGGNDIVLYGFALAPTGTVPEPVGLAFLGLAVMGLRIRRRT